MKFSLPGNLSNIPKRKLALIVGVILGVLLVFMIKGYLDQQKALVMERARRALEEIQADQVTVLIAKNDIAPGVLVEPDMLEPQIVRTKQQESRSVNSLARIEGMIAAVPIVKGEQITLDKLMYIRDRGGLSGLTPVGKRAITISVDNISSLAGLLKPGDYIDVIAMIPVPIRGTGGQATQMSVMPLFQNVLVLAVGQKTQPKSRFSSRLDRKEDTGISSLITLALSPKEASIISFVQEQGRLRLVLRSPADSHKEPPQPVSWETVFQYVMPELLEGPETAPKPPTVEVYRGMKKEEMILSQ